MQPQEKLQRVYSALHYRGIVTSRRDFAEKLGYNYNVLSSAFNGTERYLTPNLFRNIGRAFSMLDKNWLASDDPEGEPIVEAEEAPETAPVASDPADLSRTRARANASPLLQALLSAQDQTERALEQTNRALDQMDKLVAIIEKLAGISFGND